MKAEQRSGNRLRLRRCLGRSRPGPFHAQRCERDELVGVQPVSPRFGVRDPYAQLHGHRLRLAVERDLDDRAAWDRPVRAFLLNPLSQGRETVLERLLRLARPRRAACCWGRNRGGRRRLDAQGGQPPPLLGQQPRPGGRLLLLLEPLADVVAAEDDARSDVGQDTVGVDQVRQHAVVPLPVQRPRAVSVLVDRGQLRRVPPAGPGPCPGRSSRPSGGG